MKANTIWPHLFVLSVTVICAAMAECIKHTTDTPTVYDQYNAQGKNYREIQLSTEIVQLFEG